MVVNLRAHLRRFHVYGDYLTRIQGWVVRRCPFFVEPVLLAGYAALFFLACGAARRAIVANLGVVLSGSGGFANWWRAYGVILSYSGSLTDALRRRDGEDVIEWEIEGERHLAELAGRGAGAVLLTAHMGNYDIAARVFADRFRRRIHAVRAPERQPDAQELRRRALEGGDPPVNLTVRYNERDAMLGVELAKAIADGEVVAIQGDRAVFEVAAIDVPFDARHTMRVPKGPFALGAMTGCAIYPVIFLRTGYRRYRVIARPPFACARKRGPAQARLIEEAAQRWLAALRPILRKHWRQWYVFERAFAERAGAGARPGGEAGMADSKEGEAGHTAPFRARERRRGAIRSATPLFVLMDRLRGERPRPGVDHVVAAGTPGQNGLETAAWTVLATGLAAAGVMRGLEACGLGTGAVLALAAPLTFAALHAGIGAVGAVGVVGAAAGLRRGAHAGPAAGRIWIAGGSVLAAWLVVEAGWTRVAGWIWLTWLSLQALAWMINKLWESGTGKSR